MTSPIDPAQPIDPARALVEQHGQFLRGLARALTRDETTAQDIEQETWRAAIEHGGPLREPRAWLTATARKLAWTRHRRDGRRSDRERRVARPEASAASPSPDAALDAGDLLQSALRALDEPFRGAIVARYMEGLEPREIAVRDGVPLETVKSRLKRGLAKLRTELDRRHGGERRVWSASLVMGLGLDDPGAAAAGSASFARSPDTQPFAPSASAPLIPGGPLAAAITMKLQLVALGLVASMALVWGLGYIQRDTPRAERLVEPEASPSDDSLAQLASLDESTSSPERAEVAAPAPEAPILEFTLALDVQVDDEHGRPAPGLMVQIAPAGHPFNVAGFTNRGGSQSSRWSSKVPTMEVDVAVSSRSFDLVGVQRLEVTAGTVRKLVVRAPRRGAARARPAARPENATEEREVVDTTPNRPRPARPESVTLEDGSMGFRWRAFEEIEQSSEMRSGSLEKNEQGRAVVEGTLVDTAGRPVEGYAIRFVEPPSDQGGRPAREASRLTDLEGRFRIETRPGTLRCRVGPRGHVSEWEADVASGTTTTWNPVISRDRDVMVQLAGARELGLRQVVVQVRHDDGITRWVGRAVATEAGRAAILDCPADLVDVELLAPGNAASLPFAKIDAVRPGDILEHAMPLETKVAFLPVELMPGDGGEGGASAAELLIFEAADGAGVRARIRGGKGSTSSIVLPTGTFQVELAWQGGGVTDLGQVLVMGELPVDMGAISAPALSRIRIPEAAQKDDVLEVHRVMEAIDSLVYGSADMWDGLPKDRVVALAPGEYRLRVTSAEGTPRVATFTVKDGKAVTLELP